MEENPAPRNRLTNFSPIFPVRDLRRSLAHYESLGFTVKPYADGDYYGFASRDGVSLHLSAEGHDHADQPAPGHGHQHAGAAYLYVADADALYAEWTVPGTGGVTRRVGDTDYRLREGSHLDPDGNLIRFGSPMPSQPAARLRSHLEARYAIGVGAMTELDVGVWRVERPDGPDWVARWFPARRTVAAVAGDAAILRYLAGPDYPAERCAAGEPVSELDGRAVLVTEWAPAVPREQRRAAIRGAGGLARLGALLGRLHTLPADDAVPALARPGGGWHHLADGPPSAELAAGARLLAAAAHLVDDGERDAYARLRAAVDAVDAGDGLPEALTHPDFVMANVVATGDGLVIVDWSGAGRAPRAWSLAWLLYAEGLKDLRRVDRVMAGYARHVTLTDAELSRLAALIPARAMVFIAWSVLTGQATPTQALASAAAAQDQGRAIADRARAALTR